MRIVCPSCSAAYEVPDSLVTAGRVVRCARCGNDWTPVAAVAEPLAATADPEPTLASAEAVAESAAPAGAPELGGARWSSPRPSAMDRLAAHPVGPPSRLRLRLAWAASVIVLGLLIWGGYAWRSQIAAAWPPSARVYAAFGLSTGGSPTR